MPVDAIGSVSSGHTNSISSVSRISGHNNHSKIENLFENHNAQEPKWISETAGTLVFGNSDDKIPETAGTLAGGGLNILA